MANIALREEDLGALRMRTADITALTERREALLVESERVSRLLTYAQEALSLWLVSAYDLDVQNARYHIDLEAQAIISLPA